MNENGYSWPEAILTLTVIVVIFGTLLPFVTRMTSIIHAKKMSMYAAETAYQGTISYNAYGTTEGVRQVEGVSFEWIVYGDSICVSYMPNDKVTSKCINF